MIDASSRLIDVDRWERAWMCSSSSYTNSNSSCVRSWDLRKEEKTVTNLRGISSKHRQSLQHTAPGRLSLFHRLHFNKFLQLSGRIEMLHSSIPITFASLSLHGPAPAIKNVEYRKSQIYFELRKKYCDSLHRELCSCCGNGLHKSFVRHRRKPATLRACTGDN